MYTAFKIMLYLCKCYFSVFMVMSYVLFFFFKFFMWVLRFRLVIYVGLEVLRRKGSDQKLWYGIPFQVGIGLSCFVVRRLEWHCHQVFLCRIFSLFRSWNRKERVSLELGGMESASSKQTLMRHPGSNLEKVSDFFFFLVQINFLNKGIYVITSFWVTVYPSFLKKEKWNVECPIHTNLDNWIDLTLYFRHHLE